MGTSHPHTCASHSSQPESLEACPGEVAASLGVPGLGRLPSRSNSAGPHKARSPAGQGLWPGHRSNRPLDAGAPECGAVVPRHHARTTEVGRGTMPREPLRGQEGPQGLGRESDSAPHSSGPAHRLLLPALPSAPCLLPPHPDALARMAGTPELFGPSLAPRQGPVAVASVAVCLWWSGCLCRPGVEPSRFRAGTLRRAGSPRTQAGSLQCSVGPALLAGGQAQLGLGGWPGKMRGSGLEGGPASGHRKGTSSACGVGPGGAWLFPGEDSGQALAPRWPPGRCYCCPWVLTSSPGLRPPQWKTHAVPTPRYGGQA